MAKYIINCQYWECEYYDCLLETLININTINLESTACGISGCKKFWIYLNYYLSYLSGEKEVAMKYISELLLERVDYIKDRLRQLEKIRLTDVGKWDKKWADHIKIHESPSGCDCGCNKSCEQLKEDKIKYVGKHRELWIEQIEKYEYLLEIANLRLGGETEDNISRRLDVSVPTLKHVPL